MAPVLIMVALMPWVAGLTAVAFPLLQLKAIITINPNPTTNDIKF